MSIDKARTDDLPTKVYVRSLDFAKRLVSFDDSYNQTGVRIHHKGHVAPKLLGFRIKEAISVNGEHGCAKMTSQTSSDTVLHIVGYGRRSNRPPEVLLIDIHPIQNQPRIFIMSTMQDLCTLTVKEIGVHLAAGTTTSVELVNLYLGKP